MNNVEPEVIAIGIMTIILLILSGWMDYSSKKYKEELKNFYNPHRHDEK